MDGNDIAARFIQSVNWDRLPEAVRHKVKMCLVDIVAATVGGVLTPISDIVAAYASETWRGDEATILLHDRRASAAGAAFANAYAANGLDCDDGAKYTRGHPGAQVFPTALAVGEKIGVHGSAMLAAMVVGYEVAHRVGRCWHRHHQVFQADGSWGSVACAATAANLMRLDEDRIKQALGIAEYHAPNLPMERDLREPAMVKHGHGWGAMTGIVAAELAGRGFTGIPSLLGFTEYQDWVAREHDWGVEDIAAIKVEGHHWTAVLQTSHPTTTEEAQFSVKWPLAAFLIDGEVGPDQILERRFCDASINALVDKIELVESEEIDKLYRPSFDEGEDGSSVSRVVICLKDGATLDSGLVPDDSRLGQRGDEAKLEQKFRWLTRYVLEEDRIDTLLEMLWHFEDVQDVGEFASLLRRR